MKADIPPEYQVVGGSNDAYNNAWFDNGGHALSSGHFTGTDASVQTHGSVWYHDGSNTNLLGAQNGQTHWFSSLVPRISQPLSSSTTIPTSKTCGLTLVVNGDFSAEVKYLGQTISGGAIPVNPCDVRDGCGHVAHQQYRISYHKIRPVDVS